MHTYTRLAAAAVVAVVVAGGALYLFGPRGGVGPATPTATPEPGVTASPAGTTTMPTFPIDVTTWTPFTQSLYGYTVAYPSGFQRSPASELWAGQTSYDMWASAANAPWADKTYSSMFGTTMIGLATIVPAGTSEEAWIDAYMAPGDGTTPTCTELAKDMVAIVIDGKPARLMSRCDDRAAFVFVGDRMFVFASSSSDLSILNAYLSTVRLPAPTASPT